MRFSCLPISHSLCLNFFLLSPLVDKKEFAVAIQPKRLSWKNMETYYLGKLDLGKWT